MYPHIEMPYPSQREIGGRGRGGDRGRQRGMEGDGGAREQQLAFDPTASQGPPGRAPAPC